MNSADIVIEQNAKALNDVHEDRNWLALLAASLAAEQGYSVGFGTDVAEPSWPVLYIDLPTGQISYHLTKEMIDRLPALPRYVGEWDGHSTDEKRRRILEYITGVEREEDEL